ncbi:uncharacterized protein MICPUCDRAFT_55930 [Micromonas pusilla CCMP1545]|uniref:Predicted protein n=1 Tax=Micromonas pusilla (strain CCMP1545) TaxID=564608 RepID=C1MNJ8_MICPC|nr:uncharacterized protein MICPUCDRAFT_55930 [Micromonas pusilla CCMP1545]EEH58763.1 predicted protein [Micromonas pusilla CCMP1545]|eukprot:XP_003057118.1 predicted protein [Micromonas pusilla CCMP1545]
MSTLVIGAPARLVVRAAVHPKHKATKGHTKNRPKKHRPSDKVRKAVVYPEVKPEDVPPLMTVLSKK